MTEKIVNIKTKNFLPDDKYLLDTSIKGDEFRYLYNSVVVYNRKLLTSDDIFNPPVLENFQWQGTFQPLQSRYSYNDIEEIYGWQNW